MDGVTVGLDGREDHSSIFVRELIRSPDRYASIGYGMLVNSPGVLNSERDVLDTIAMLNQMLVHLLG